MKVSTENDNNFGHEQITIVVDNIPLIYLIAQASSFIFELIVLLCVLLFLKTKKKHHNLFLQVNFNYIKNTAHIYTIPLQNVTLNMNMGRTSFNPQKSTNNCIIKLLAVHVGNKLLQRVGVGTVSR
jgi:hypothetical protein